MKNRLLFEICLSALLANCLSPAVFGQDGATSYAANPYSSPFDAGAKPVQPGDPLHDVYVRYHKYLELSEDQGNQNSGVTIDFKVDPISGEVSVSNPLLAADKQVYWCFLDAAVMVTAAPAKIRERDRFWFEHQATRTSLFFEIRSRRTESAAGFKTISAIREKLPKTTDDVAVLRIIPKQISEFYPALFGDIELDDISNFRKISGSNVNLENVIALRQPWISLFKAGVRPTKEQVLNLKKKIDSDFSSLISKI